jgi:hypothetical protein
MVKMGLLATLQPESIIKWTLSIGPQPRIKGSLLTLLFIMPVVILLLLTMKLAFAGVGLSIFTLIICLAFTYIMAFLIAFYVETVNRLAKIMGAIGILICLAFMAVVIILF